MEKIAYRRWLETRFGYAPTISNLMSRVGRLERAFGDLDKAYARDKMASVLAVLDDARTHKRVPAGIHVVGDPLEMMSVLRSAANSYHAFKTSMDQEIDLGRFLPLKAPRPAVGRKLAPTGFWAFQANPERWDTDAWVISGQDQLLYLVNPDDRDLMQVGDLGVIRRTSSRRGPAAVIALVEVLEEPRVRPEPDPRFFRDADEGTPSLRTSLEVLALLEPPLPVSKLSEASQRLKASLQRTTVAIEPESFAELAQQAGLTPLALGAQRAGRTPEFAASVERTMQSLDAVSREIISRKIERGPIGDRVKTARGHICQVCEALGHPAIAFKKRGGSPYAEAHHIVPVSTLQRGVLAPSNVMVLCPNHHRQAHYGDFVVIEDAEHAWTVSLDGQVLPEIRKTVLG